jgi:ABC-type amino acid transport substrate-binding protein
MPDGADAVIPRAARGGVRLGSLAVLLPARLRGLTVLVATLSLFPYAAVVAPAEQPAGPGVPSGQEPGPGVLRLCADPDNLPFSSAAQGERGLYVDLAELVASRLGMPTEYAWWYTFYGKRAVRNTLLADRCDAFFGLPHDADFMGRNLLLTRPFLDVGWAIIAPAGVGFSHVDELKPRRLAVVFRSTPQLLLASRGGFQTVTFRTDEEALDALGRGDVEAAFVWGPAAGYHNARKLGGTHRVVPVAAEGLQWRATVAVRKDSAVLRDRIDGALAALQPEIRRLADRYGFPQGPAVSFTAGGSAAERAGDQRRARDAGGFAEPAPATAGDPAAGMTPAPDAIAVGRRVFNQHCSHCHAPNAVSPEPSRDLRRLRIRYGSSTTEIFFAAVTRGRPDKGMPEWSHLGRASLERVWVFLDSVQSEP